MNMTLLRIIIATGKSRERTWKKNTVFRFLSFHWVITFSEFFRLAESAENREMDALEKGWTPDPLLKE